MVSHELPERSRRLLAALVREHIATGEPVSSQTLARESGLGVSSATIRNLFARLEAEGYLHQPHTSAGRVPTDRGYRVFVDPFSAQYLSGVTIDYVSSMQGSGFTFKNPNSTGGCGCGSSFSA